MEAEASNHYCSRCLTSFRADPVQCPNLACSRQRPENGWGRIFGPGETFDRAYRIHKLLAMGGGGITYLVRELNDQDEEFGPRLAIKALFAYRGQGAYLRRLAMEAQILQEMNHPHIVEYQGFVHRAGRTPYLVTRFEAGGSLMDHIERVGTLSVRNAAAIGVQICEALHKAHETGVTHRDLKPENVLLAEEVPADTVPHVRLVDFGIAKVNSSLSSNLTRAGAFVGTPHFASPEQFIGAKTGPPSDVYSVGAMLSFCMMGRYLVHFADRLAPEDGYQLLLDCLPASINRPSDPPEDVERMNRVLARVTATSSDSRCSASELRAMLDAISRGEPPPLLDPAPPPATDPADSPQPAPLLDTVSEPTSSPEPTSGNDTADRTATPTPAPLLGRGCLPAVLALGTFALLLAGGTYVGLQLFQERQSWSAPRLSENETDPSKQEDFRRIDDSFRNLAPWLAESCPASAQTQVLIEVSLTAAADQKSQIAAARIHEGGTPELAACITSQLTRGVSVNRNQDQPVRFAKWLTWP